MFLARRRPRAGRPAAAALLVARWPVALSCPAQRGSASTSRTSGTPTLAANHNGVGKLEGEPARKEKQQRRGLELLKSAMEEVRHARRDLGWGVDELAMRITLLVLHKIGKTTTGVPREATMVGHDEASPDKVTDWERLLCWAHASYGRNARIVEKRIGLQPGDMEMITISSGKDRGRPLSPTYVLAVDHRHREVVLSVRGTKAIGDAITISHFRPEPFLDGFAHRGFAQSAHELAKEISPQLTALRERLPDYRVLFTGHSLGGGIAAMASMLLRASGDCESGCTASSSRGSSSYERAQHQRDKHRKQQEQQEQQDQLSEEVSAALDIDGDRQPGSLKRSEQEPAKHREKPRDLVTHEQERQQEGEQEQEPGDKQAWRRELEVISFATPSCVSLELAQRCKPWVTSIVYGDDAVPRLSTVSLDLLEEDMTAAEWRRTLDRLSRIGNRPLINLSTESVAAAIKSAVGDRRGTLGLKIRRRDGESDGAGQQAIKNHSGLGRKAQIPEEEAAAAVGCADGESGEVDNKAGKEERVALRRAVRDTVLAMRGLAEVSPLSVADRQEITNMVDQVVIRTGGEKPKMDDVVSGSIFHDGRGADDSGENTVKTENSFPDTASDVLKSDGTTSRFQLFSLLKESVKNLGADRAALQRSGGSGGGTGSAKEEHGEPRAEPCPGSCAADPTLDAEGTKRAVTAASAATARTGGGKGSDLHELFSAREEPMLLPLYPPGDPFLICNASRVHKSRASSLAHARSAGEATAAIESTSSWEKRVGDTGSTDIVVGIEGVSVDRTVGSIGVDSSVGSTDGVESTRLTAGTTGAGSARKEVNVATAMQAAAAAAAAAGGAAASQSGHIERKTGAVGVIQGATADGAQTDVDRPWGGTREDDEFVLVRVPHQHFLRMPVSPSMISDHFTSSYRHGLAGVKKHGMMMREPHPRG